MFKSTYHIEWFISQEFEEYLWDEFNSTTQILEDSELIKLYKTGRKSWSKCFYFKNEQHTTLKGAQATLNYLKREVLPFVKFRIVKRITQEIPINE